MMRVELPGGPTLSCETGGAGFPVLLIAGLGRDRGMWAAQVPVLSGSFRVISFDNRGTGASSRPKGPYTAAELADDAAGLLDALGIARAHLVGASLGGMIAQEFERRHPERTATLSLLCTTPGLPLAVPMSPAVCGSIVPDPGADPLARLTGAMKMAFSADYWERNAARLAEEARARLADPVPAEVWWAQAAAGAGFSSRFRSPLCPCLVMTGDEDRIVPPVNSELLASRTPGARLRIFPGGGHYFFVEQHEAVNAVLLEFLGTAAEDSADRTGRAEATAGNPEEGLTCESRRTT